MKLLGVSLSLCLLLIVGQMDPISSTVSSHKKSACIKQRQNCPKIPGSFCPKCDNKGNFLPQQCSGSTGYCWCVNVNTGQKIPGTATPPGTPPVNCEGPCIKKQQNCPKLIGSFCPQCDNLGNFLPQQCSGSTGYCWCVNVNTGQTIPGTATPPGTPPVNCDGPCIKEKQNCTNNPGSFCPQCDSNGNFLPQQCSASIGYCWCVFISNGETIPGTETRPVTHPVTHQGTTPMSTAGTPPVNCVILQDIGA